MEAVNGELLSVVSGGSDPSSPTNAVLVGCQCQRDGIVRIDFAVEFRGETETLATRQAESEAVADTVRNLHRVGAAAENHAAEAG